jgi:dynein heavy chain, axonemal
VQARDVAKIQQEVGEKQRSTEADLSKVCCHLVRSAPHCTSLHHTTLLYSAILYSILQVTSSFSPPSHLLLLTCYTQAEPMVEAAMAALNTLDKKDLGEAKTMAKPPTGVDDVFAATMILLASVHPNVIIQKNGKVKDRSWDACKKQLLGSIPEYIDYLKGIKTGVDNNTIPKLNFKEVKELTDLEHFKPEIILTKNKAAAGLCSFVVNIVMYHEVVVTVEPKRKALQDANDQLETANAELSAVIEQVTELEAKLAKLTAELNAANKEKQEALDSVEKRQRKLDLAQRLTNALASENVRWAENILTMKADKELLTGDVLLASAFVSYVGPFTKVFRDRLMGEIFIPYLRDNFQKALGEGAPIPLSASADPLKILTSTAQVASWGADGLPADHVSIENGTIVTTSSRWPLIIDPQLQGIKWLKQKESHPDRNLQVVRLGQSDMIKKLESALENGHTILIENIAEVLDAVLNPVIQRAVIKRGRKMFIKLGDTEVEFHPDFRLFLHTKLSNPHYPPEIQAETTLVNFTVTSSGLGDQMLALVVRKERPDLAQLSEDLVKQQNDFTIKVKELEDNILSKLATAQGDITEDVELIEGLEYTKKMANEISVKQVLASATQVTIKQTSEKYRGVADRSALLFFLMTDLVKIHTYYIYSLEAFITVFYRGIDKVTDLRTAREKEREREKDRDHTGDCDGESDIEGGGDGDRVGDVDVDGDGAVVVEVENVESDQAEGEGEEGRELSSEQLTSRCIELRNSITATVFEYLRRGVFETDKLTVATLFTLRVAVNDGTYAIYSSLHLSCTSLLRYSDFLCVVYTLL